MINVFKKLLTFLQSEIQYQHNINMDKNKYERYLIEMYKKRTGGRLDFNNPRKYTEKIQYAKLYLNSPTKTKLSDKYRVREWVSEKIGEKYLIPILGVWNTFSEIEFANLPNQFVLKTNNGAGTNIIVKDKNNFRYLKSRIKINHWLRRNYAYLGLELHYKDIKPLIIAEQFMEDSNGQLNDYKFLCFDGKVYYCWIDVGRYTNRYRNIYNLNWELQPWNLNVYENTPWNIEKPKNFDHMIEIAEKLCEGFSHVRVDLYNIDGKVYFGEMTFTNAAGFANIYPEEYDLFLGDLWDIGDVRTENSK